MKIIEQGHEILYPNIHDPKVAEALLERIEAAGRTCYKSEDKITPGSAAKFVAMIRKSGHESVLEHESIQVRITTDRGVTHEQVRHRIGIAYSQESTRYCNYGDGHIQFILPVWMGGIETGFYKCWDSGHDRGIAFSETDDHDTFKVSRNPMTLPADLWLHSMSRAENDYQYLIQEGWSPQQARSVLPNSLKTEIVVTANIRTWRHIFSLRCSPKAHPQMQALMIPLLNDFNHCLPILFGDLHQELGGVYKGKDMI